ncbi:hypothetical protein [Polymorphum gilvum]|uniref:Membrane protein, putative n=1 Tax=Polymorphum gilvum (strain LMG 25793 / CGMCC 1.9160 / SL003B-26A1) TaxID=991905 RepID=F2J4Q7_POLGS|nr:hypothetical protein [Polymorphum gilvum]ADZ68999.1 Membrane protein, putative [Polymorphum gilvum SL003B-26A1]
MTRSSTVSANTDRRPQWKLAVLLYPFTAAAVAVNLFMLALMGQAVGLNALSPHAALALSVVLGVPATWAAARWVRHLLDQAEERPPRRNL